MAEPVENLLEALARIKSEETGTRTFARYKWQAKQAVRHWLTCLKSDRAPIAIICEKLEDLAIVYHDFVRFAQLKTRDRGSWSANATCDKGHGIDSLIRAYKGARDVGVHENSAFELWLEGPMSDLKETVSFFENPTTAPSALRTKMVALGLPRNLLDDFLSRLIIHVKQPSRAHIDAVILREMAALWPGQSIPELEDVYTRLLEVASAAQAGEPALGAVRRLVAACVASPGELTVPDDLSVQYLSKSQIAFMTPPLGGETDQDLLDRMSAGEITSMLELKMRRAGVSPSVLKQAQDLRAQAEISRQLLLASRSDVDGQFAQLDTRILTVARAIADKANLNSATNPVAAARPADYISTELLSNPGILGQLDKSDLFEGDGLELYGYLCHLSDACRFPWRAA
ncbi:dsDNA nuclease domain-containing protein [Streptomyces sp. NRRL S-15]|uniref:dsDNA nuclease domain-containing protein n=1 Tax=Streptomyces sp. NRRL S-15 TaxID=1463886 RepID=UPI00099DECDC|nr:dsDNA nuclease domain-containing protein [Streptomyces sp. NRRL S-15]